MNILGLYQQVQFCASPKRDKMWFYFVNILYVVPDSAETKRGKKFEKFVQENMMENFFTVLDIQCGFLY